ncbi:hypothetical protein ATO10_11847 [Actibacterium atlanticum]|uniref:Uncharacterized protein n=1 Tax=Actibacterium atlanticum TaxID=1461693 RepID=A0A058ZJ03_9RHOB|nr:hypothetical protein [Actibacterium atlanticum]KCV81604.1 hypothetical protein ATO10_11847 [Actibacterium atlanticum]
MRHLRKRFQRLLNKSALARVERRPAPAMIPMGRSTKETNCYYAYLHLRGQREKSALFDAIEDQEVICRLFDEAERRFHIPSSIPVQELENYQLEVTRFLGPVRSTHNTALIFLIADTLGYSWIALRWDQLRQHLFNITYKSRTDRIVLLSELVELYINAKSSNQSFQEPDLGTAMNIYFKLHGGRSASRSRFYEEYARFELLLKSLLDSGDLSYSNDTFSYQLKARSLRTIAEFESEQQRHEDQVKQNRRLLWLTVIIAISALIGALDVLGLLEMYWGYLS